MNEKGIIERDGTVRIVNDLATWAGWFEDNNMKNYTEGGRRVGDDTINGVRISTVFLGMNHAWGGGPPLWFETMIFGGKFDQEQWRYTTIQEALSGHAKAINLVAEGS